MPLFPRWWSRLYSSPFGGAAGPTGFLDAELTEGGSGDFTGSPPLGVPSSTRIRLRLSAWEDTAGWPMPFVMIESRESGGADASSARAFRTRVSVNTRSPNASRLPSSTASRLTSRSNLTFSVSGSVSSVKSTSNSSF